MVINANTATRPGKRGKIIDTVVDNLGYCLYGLCTFPNMVISTNIVTKSGGKKEKKTRHLDTGVDNVGALFMWSKRIS